LPGCLDQVLASEEKPRRLRTAYDLSSAACDKIHAGGEIRIGLERKISSRIDENGDAMLVAGVDVLFE
jgi:hypothetical protein